MSERLVEFPNKRKVSFDVMGHGSYESVFVFPLDTEKRSVTLIQEYSPGQHQIMFGFPAGFVENAKHKSLEDAARAELSEEAFLLADQLVKLTGSNGIAADKYSRNKFNFFVSEMVRSDPAWTTCLSSTLSLISYFLIGTHYVSP